MSRAESASTGVLSSKSSGVAIVLCCTEFCLSGYPHAREAERFGEMVIQLFNHRITNEPLVASSGAATAV